MNMKKVLAAGVAATLAVTSLAAVASAEETRSYDMVTTYGKAVYTPTVAKGAQAIDPGSDYDFVVDTSATPAEYRTFGVAAGVTQATTGTQESDQDTNGDGVVNELDYDMFIPFEVSASFADMFKFVGSLSVTIKGKKIASNGASTVDLTQTAQLVKVTSVNGDTDVNYILPIYNNGGPTTNAFVPERFVQIDEISFTATPSNKTFAFSGLTREVYEDLIGQKDADGNPAPWSVSVAWDPIAEEIQVYDNNDDIVAPWVIGWTQGGCEAANIFIELADAFNADAFGNDTANVIYTVDTYNNGVITGTGFGVADASDTASGAAATSADLSGGLLMSKIRSMLQTGVAIALQADYGQFSTEDRPAWMPMTDLTGVIGRLERNDIWNLSDTTDYDSLGLWSWAYDEGSYENWFDNQTYTIEDYNKGTQARGFSGLASQVADFFNLQKNGKIEFVFDAYTPAAAVNTWKTGGIPSTEVGLRNFLEAAKVKDFALFFNYNSSTGSLQSNATLDVATGSVIFDISDILKDMGGFTKGNVNDIYYGLANGINYNGAVGLWVSKVILSYEADAAVSGDEATKDDEKEEEVKEDDKGDVAVDEDDDEGEIEIADDTDDDTDDDDDTDIVIGDDDEDDATVVVTPDDDATVVVNPGTEKTPAGADENPHTGVALAVVPMIAAAAAMVISKKRK